MLLGNNDAEIISKIVFDYNFREIGLDVKKNMSSYIALKTETRNKKQFSIIFHYLNKNHTLTSIFLLLFLFSKQLLIKYGLKNDSFRKMRGNILKMHENNIKPHLIISP